MSSHLQGPGRRDFLKMSGAAALGTPLMGGGTDASASERTRGLPPLKITDVRVIVTCPGRNYVVVKVLTSEPGLYGVGDATLNGRELAVATALRDHIAPLLIGRDPEQVEDIYQYLYRGSYWRSGPIQMTAIAGMTRRCGTSRASAPECPSIKLLGRRTRIGALAYTHASGNEFSEVEDAVRRGMERGFKCVRAQVALPGLASTYGTSTAKKSEEHAGRVDQQAGMPETEIFEPSVYLRTVPKLF